MAETYQDSIKKYQDILKKSQTAYGSGLSPTAYDISAQQKLLKFKKSAEVAKSEKLKEQWYDGGEGEDKLETVDDRRDQGLIGKGLKTLGTPLYSVVGAIESLLGKGTEKGLLENIKANIEEEGTMTDLLKSYGQRDLVSIPLGLALDIALDPVAWATLGTSALVPRVAVGAMKAGTKGAKVAAESNLLGKATWVGRRLGLQKDVADTSKFKKLSELYKKADEKIIKSTKEYEELTGDTINNALKNSMERKRFFPQMTEKLGQSSFGRGLNKLFDYDSVGQLKSSMESAKEITSKAISESTSLLFGKGIDGKDLKTMRAIDARKVQVETERVAKETKEFQKAIKKEIDTMKSLFETDAKNLTKLGALGDAEKKSMAETFMYYESGFKAYDKMVAKLLMNPKAKKSLEIYGTYTGLFKVAKIGGNLLTAGINAIVGNMAMTSMMGINVTSTKFLGAMKEAIGVTTSRDAKALAPFFREDKWVETIKKFSDAFEAVFGIKPAAILDSRRYLDDTVNVALKNGSVNLKEVEGLKKAYDDAIGVLSSQISLSPELRTVARTSQHVERTSFLTEEIMRGPYSKFLEKAKKMGENGNRAAALYYKASTTTMEAYARVDQTYRVGLALHLTKNGISSKELKLIAKRMPIDISDVTKAGESYRLSPVKAMEIAQETYMNYLAMPSFVKIMRTLPLAGFPFVSFAYGMTALSAKTLMYNPAFYNRIQFMLKELSGRKSPLEKEALESEYYSWLDKPGMLRVPFFEENPLYLNVANMLPHYTMNALQPTERTYADRYGTTIASIIDKSPFLKTPDGQVMLDYLILPSILKEERATGMFGQPLWEKDAGPLKKAGYATRSLIESVVPPATGFAGLGTSIGMPPEGALPYIPSYRMRQLGFATKGKTSIGALSKEPATERVAKIMSAMAGFPLYSVDIKYSGAKKKSGSDIGSSIKSFSSNNIKSNL